MQDESLAVELDFEDDGLITAIAQDLETNEVLMFAYVSPEALAETRQTGLAHYYSRSRDELWQKGQSSGNVQQVDEIRVDCDGLVSQAACCGVDGTRCVEDDRHVLNVDRLVGEQVLVFRVDVRELLLRGDVEHRAHTEYDDAIDV